MKGIARILCLIALMVLLPFFFSTPRWLHFMIMVYLYIILAGGLRMIMTTGQVSFAHAAFWAIGAYSSALLVMRGGLSFWIALPIAGLISAVFGILIGYPCLKLKGPYFFIITLSFGEIARLFFTTWVDVFGGANGIAGIPLPNPLSIPLIGYIKFSPRGVHFYYLILAILLVALFVMYRLERSRFGISCDAIRESDELAAALGISPIRHKVTLFIVACFFAGLAGSFYAHYITYISPDFFTFWESMTMLLIVAIGGSGSTSGVILGAFLLTIIPEVGREVKQLEPIIFGGILMIALRFVPGGLWGILRGFYLKLRLAKQNLRG